MQVCLYLPFLAHAMGSKLLCCHGFNYKTCWFGCRQYFYAIMLHISSVPWLFILQSLFLKWYFSSKVICILMDCLILQELLFPFIQVGKIVYSLSQWEDPLKSLLFLAFMLYVIQR
jgi:hypothetical protein